MQKLLLIDDHPLFLKGMVLILESMLPNSVIITENTFKKVKETILKHQPDIILLDLMMPDCNQLRCLQLLIHNYPLLPIAVMSSSEKFEHIERSLEYGAKGYIPKTSNPDEMITAITKILSGGCYVPAHFLNLNPKEEAHHKYKLSSRQLEILDLVAQGLSNKATASMLYIAEGTVKQHMSSIFKIMNVKNRTAAVQLAKKHLNL